MAVTLIKNGNFYITRTQEYWIDSEADLGSIPVETPTYSTAVDPNTGKVYFKSPEGTWKEFGGNVVASFDILK